MLTLSIIIWLLCGLGCCGVINFIDHLQGGDVTKRFYVVAFFLGAVTVGVILVSGIVFLVRDQGEKLMTYLERKLR